MSAIKLTQNQLFTAICLALALVTLAVYWPVTGNDFVNFDDDLYITGNPHITSGLTQANVVWAFQSGEQGNWHPLTWISHMIDCGLYGVNPGGHHLTNLLFHIANTLLLFALLRQMTGAMWRSAFVAALFAWHPLHVESVAWASERKDVLSAFFWMLTLLAYVRYAQKKSINPRLKTLNYFLALFFFACALMSKPMAVTLPFVLLLLDFWPLNRIRNSEFRIQNLKIALEKIPFLALAAAASAVTFLVQKNSGALWPSPLPDRLGNAVLAYARYLSKIFWPVDLAIVYPYQNHLPLLPVIGATLLLAVWSGLFLFRARQQPFLLMGWLWFLGTLVPTIGIVQAGAQSMADRYTYIPSIGLFIVIVWGANEIFESQMEWKRFLPLAGSVALIGCLAVTSLQIGYWRNSTSLFLHAIAVTDDNYVADNCLGKAFEKAGDKEKALFFYTKAVEMEPRYPQSQFNLATTLLDYGRADEALEHLTIAAELSPHDPDIQYDLGVFYLLHDQPEKATGHFKTVLNENPFFPQAEYHLAQALSRQHKSSKAISHYREALRQTPDFPDALNELAWILATDSDSKIRSGTESIQLAKRACDLTQNQQPVFLATLAAAYAETGQFEKAIATIQASDIRANSTAKMEIITKNKVLENAFQSGNPYRE